MQHSEKQSTKHIMSIKIGYAYQLIEQNLLNNSTHLIGPVFGKRLKLSGKYH